MLFRCPKCGYGTMVDDDAILVLCPKCGEYIQRVCALRRHNMIECEQCSNYGLQKKVNCWKNRQVMT